MVLRLVEMVNPADFVDQFSSALMLPEVQLLVDTGRYFATAPQIE